MPRSQAEKLMSSLPKVPGASRRQQFSASTKRALVEVATTQFSEHGYGGTSLDSIVAGARVTKGALYHHFSGKQAVFEAVFASVEDDASVKIRSALRGANDPWEKARAGLREFLAIVQDPVYQRVVIQDGPAILGYERFREQEERSSYGIVQDIVGSVLEASTYEDYREFCATTAPTSGCCCQTHLLRRHVGRRRERLDRRGPQAGGGAHRGRHPVHPRGHPLAGRAGRRADRSCGRSGSRSRGRRRLVRESRAELTSRLATCGRRPCRRP